MCCKVAPAPSSCHRRRRGGTAVVVRPSRRRVLKALQALPLQALHLAYEAAVDLRRMTCAYLGQRTPISGGDLISSRSDHHGHRR